jgi:hypothetical protein
VLTARPGTEQAFGPGLISLLGTTAVRISGITFEPPPVGLGTGAAGKPATQKPATQKATAQKPAAQKATAQKASAPKAAAPSVLRTAALADAAAVTSGLEIAIALRPVDCTGLSVEHCVFSLASTQKAGRDLVLFAVGIFTGGTCEGLTVTGCRFYSGSTADSIQEAVQRVTVGILASPTLMATVSTRAKAPSAAYLLVPAGLDGLAITGTRFDQLTIATLTFAAMGGARIEDNSVSGCYGGFWLISPDMPAYLDLTGSYAARNMDQPTMTAVSSSVASLALDPMFLLSYVVGRIYPLPAGYQAATTASGPIVTTKQWTTNFVQRLTAGSVAALPPAQASTPASPAAPATATFSIGAATRADLVAGGGAANEAVRSAALAVMAIEQQLPYPQTSARLILRFRGNRVECSQPPQYASIGVAARDAETGPALVVWQYSQALRRAVLAEAGSASLAGGSVIAGGNELAGNCAGPIALVVLVPVVTFTGSQVLREQTKLASLAVLGVDGGAAITGNVLFGIPVLPAGRPFPSPLDTWLPLNTIVD